MAPMMRRPSRSLADSMDMGLLLCPHCSERGSIMYNLRWRATCPTPGRRRGRGTRMEKTRARFVRLVRPGLQGNLMLSEPEFPEAGLERYRDYLRLLARL